MKAMLIGSGKSVYLGHLKAIGKPFLFPVICATSWYKYTWLPWLSNLSRPLSVSSVASWRFEKSPETKPMLSHPLQYSTAKVFNCKRLWLISLDLAFGNYTLISLSAWSCPRPWRTAWGLQHIYNMKLNSLTPSSQHSDF